MIKGFEVRDLNQELLERLSRFLQYDGKSITEDMVQELQMNYGLPLLKAYGLLVAGMLQMDIEDNPIDKALYQGYFAPMLNEMKGEEYSQNPYYQQVTLPQISKKGWRFGSQSYAPYEAFVFDDFLYLEDGRVIPQIGFFTQAFPYPVVLENNREWMTVTPNEINTMKEPINHARGRVCAYGLGLGYYPYMVSQKKEVKAVTIVEKDLSVIELFTHHVLPQFPYKEKINIVHQDAFTYAQNQMKEENFDVVFTDLWHDPLDGRELYLKMKSFERQSPQSHFDYWIEKTLRYYL